MKRGQTLLPFDLSSSCTLNGYSSKSQFIKGAPDSFALWPQLGHIGLHTCQCFTGLGWTKTNWIMGYESAAPYKWAI